MCKLIRTKSGVLSLVLTTQYVNEVLEKDAARPVDPKDERPRIMVIESR